MLNSCYMWEGGREYEIYNFADACPVQHMYDVVVVRNGLFRFVHCSRSWTESWIDENSEAGGDDGYEANFATPFLCFCRFLHRRSHPTFNLCSNDRSVYAAASSSSRSLSKTKSISKIRTATTRTTTMTMARWQKLCPFILQRSNTTCTHTHTHTLWWWYNWYTSFLMLLLLLVLHITAQQQQHRDYLNIFVCAVQAYTHTIWQLDMNKKMSWKFSITAKISRLEFLAFVS